MMSACMCAGESVTLSFRNSKRRLMEPSSDSRARAPLKSRPRNAPTKPIRSLTRCCIALNDYMCAVSFTNDVVRYAKGTCGLETRGRVHLCVCLA